MKKLWIYMAVPMTLLNGCQIRPAQAAPTVNTVAERETGQEQTIPVEQKMPQNQQGMAAETIKEAAFYGSTVTIAKSQKTRAADITEEEIEAMVRMAASDLKTVVKNEQTVVLKPNLVQMIVDSTGELLDQELGGIQLEAGNGPSLEAEAGRNGDQLEIQYKTGENACKAEIFVDGIFQYSGGTVADGEIQLNIPGLSAGTHEVQIVVYDRFLNKTAKTIEV